MRAEFAQPVVDPDPGQELSYAGLHRLYRVFSSLARPDANRLVQVENEDLSVPDPAGVRSTPDGIDS